MRRFFVREGRLRLGFRLFLFVVLFDLAQLLALPLSIDRAGPAFVVLSFGIAGGLVRGAAVVGVVYALRRFVDRRDFASIGLDARPRRSLDAAFGFAIGAVAIVAVFAIETGAGWTSIIGWEVHPSVLVATLVAFFGGALAEEAAIRGYVYQNLAESGPVWRGALITGLLFAVLHAYVEGFGLGALFGFVAFTAFLVVTRIVSGSLWFAIGFHTSWNWMQDAVLGLSNVDEPDFGRALVHLEQRGPSWLVGDAPMIEGGAIAVAVLALLLVAALIYLRRAQSQSSSSQSSPSSPSAERERS